MARAIRWSVSQSKYLILGTNISVEPFQVDVTEPTAANTGLFSSTPTNVVNGDVTLTTAQTYSGNIVNGRIIVPLSATGLIIIELNKVDCSAISLSSQKNVIEVHPNTGATVIVRFNELIGQVGMIGVGNRRFTAYRNNIHHVEDAFRIHTSGGTGTNADVEIYANYCHDLIVRTPDPYNSRTDNKTHSDVIQIEGGSNVNIHGNALWGFMSTDGTSNVGWVQTSSPYLPVADGTSGASAHPQALSCLMLTPTVSALTNFKFNYNWCYGGEAAVNGGSSSNGTTVGEMVGNRFDRTQWFAGHTIDLDATATGVSTTGNVYMDDGTPVTVRRNQ